MSARRGPKPSKGSKPEPAKSVQAQAQPVDAAATAPTVVAVAATATNVSGDAAASKPLATAKAVQPGGANSNLPVVTVPLPSTAAASDISGALAGGSSVNLAVAAGSLGLKQPPFPLPKKRKHSVEEAKVRHRAVERRRVLKINTCIAQIKAELEKIGLMVRKDKASILNTVLTFLRDYNTTNKNGNAGTNGAATAPAVVQNSNSASAAVPIGGAKNATASAVVVLPQGSNIQSVAQVARTASSPSSQGSAAKRSKKSK